jgi:hypothetical protein
MVWTKDDILKALKRLYKQKADLSYNALAAKRQPLVSAAAYHFGSYRKAVERAGIDYALITRRPRWTRQMIIGLIKDARRRGDDLHWSAVTRRRDELGKARSRRSSPGCSGAGTGRCTGPGLDADEINRYRKWTKQTIVWELRARSREREPLNSGAIQRDDPGLHAAAVRHFATYDAALRAAKLDPDKVRERRSWTKADVVRGPEGREAVGPAPVRLVGAPRRAPRSTARGELFGSFTAARTPRGSTEPRRLARDVPIAHAP